MLCIACQLFCFAFVLISTLLVLFYSLCLICHGLFLSSYWLVFALVSLFFSPFLSLNPLLCLDIALDFFAFSLYSICCFALLFLYLVFHLCWVFLLSFFLVFYVIFWMYFLCFPCLLLLFPSQWLRWLLASWVPLPLSLPWPWGFSSAGWLIRVRQLSFPPPRHDSKNFLLYFFNYYSFLYFFCFLQVLFFVFLL